MQKDVYFNSFSYTGTRVSFIVSVYITCACVCVSLHHHQYEFLYQVFGRDHFGEVMCNLDVFLRRFNEIQYWVVSEICLTNTLSKRAQLLRKFIKLAA